MKVLLVNVGQHYEKCPASPPLGVISLAAWARDRIDGLRFEIIDQHIDLTDYDQLGVQIVASKPDVLGLSYMTRAAAFIPGMTRKVREALPDCKILMGGPHPSAAKAKALEETQADALVVGEGEVSFEMLLRRIREGAGFDDIPGLFHRSADGEVTQNPGSSLGVEELDDLPFLAYDLVDLPRYWTAESQSVVPAPRKYATLFTSRGCPYRCIYCHDVFGKTFRAQSAERIVAEIQFIQENYGIRDFDFMDDIFNLDKKRVYRFSELVGQNNLDLSLTMGNGVRTDILTQEVVDALCSAGVRASGFALESGSKRIQKLIKKNLNIEKFLVGVEMMAKKRVYCYGLNILGFPTETGEEMQMTIDTATESMLHQAYFFNATPYPDTGLYDAAMEICPEKLEKLDYANHDYQYETVVNLSTVSDEELAYYARKAARQFYLKPSRMYRMVRDFPKPEKIPGFLPGFMRMAYGTSKGALFRRKNSPDIQPMGSGAAY